MLILERVQDSFFLTMYTVLVVSPHCSSAEAILLEYTTVDIRKMLVSGVHVSCKSKCTCFCIDLFLTLSMGEGLY